MLDKVAEHTKLERAEAFYDDVTINEEDAQVKEKTSSLKSEKQQVIESEGAVTPEEDPYSPENLNVPDGGLRAWLVVLGVSVDLVRPLIDRLIIMMIGCMWNVRDLWLCECVGGKRQPRLSTTPH